MITRVNTYLFAVEFKQQYLHGQHNYFIFYKTYVFLMTNKIVKANQYTSISRNLNIQLLRIECDYGQFIFYCPAKRNNKKGT